VVILGGGIAGLATAYELGKAGYDCTILEARGIAGGRNFTVRAAPSRPISTGTPSGRITPGDLLQRRPGAAGTVDGHPRLLPRARCAHRGLHDINADAWIYNESAGMTAPERYRTAKADVYGYVSELLAKATNQARSTLNSPRPIGSGC